MGPKAPKCVVEITPTGEEDLDYLKRHAKNVRQHFRNKVQPLLRENPEIGEALEDDLEGLRSHDFWNSRYRVAYEVDKSDPELTVVSVLAVGLKDGFYPTLSERVRYIRRRGAGSEES